MIKDRRGTSLVEILLYFTIVSVVVFVIIGFSIDVLQLSGKSSSIQELSTNLDFITGKIEETILEADSVDELGSDFDVDAGRLALNMPVAGDSPTDIYLAEGVVYMQKGLSEAVQISSDEINCSVMRFDLLATNKVPSQIVYDLSCSAATGELGDSVNAHSAISLRK